MTHHHHASAVWFIAVVVLLVLLYFSWRSGRLRTLRAALSARRVRPRHSLWPEDVRIRPLALLPTLVLVIVVVVLLIAH